MFCGRPTGQLHNRESNFAVNMYNPLPCSIDVVLTHFYLTVCQHATVQSLWKSGVLCQEQISRTGTSNYIPHILWDVITCPCTWYLLLTEYSSRHRVIFRDNVYHTSLVSDMLYQQVTTWPYTTYNMPYIMCQNQHVYNTVKYIMVCHPRRMNMTYKMTIY